MLEQDIRDIRENLRRERYPNEAAVSQGIVLRLLHTLGWPIHEAQVVHPEYTLEGRRVDFALCYPANEPRIFIEVKGVGKGTGAERQLFEYAFHQGVPLAVLTDGREWSFFLPAGEGSYGKRRVCKLDLSASDIAESVQRFERYLRYDDVRSGAARKAAQDDYQNVIHERQKRQIHMALPEAWARLVAEEHDTLLKWVTDRVEGLCGHKPDPGTVARFLQEMAHQTGARSPRTPARPSNLSDPPPAPDETGSTDVTLPQPLNMGPAGVPLPQPLTSPHPSSTSTPGDIGFTLFGEFVPCRNQRDVLIRAIEALTNRDSSFIESFVALPQHGRTRRYIALHRSGLYPGSPHLAQESRQLRSGYWIGLNVNQEDIERIIKLACEVAGIGYGTDLTITLK